MVVSGRNIGKLDGQVVVRDQASKSGEPVYTAHHSRQDIDTRGMMSPDEHFGTEMASAAKIEDATVQIEQKGRDYCSDANVIVQGHQLRSLYENSSAIKKIVQQLKIQVYPMAKSE